ncbi:MAG TPA: TetR-like C-terminal domain-containing protein [Solirubrobacteraceae bacterium]|nr:TetR-like C-terminal domain-containing protein [Solirubrobacteraceae bacterium]
MPRVGLDAEAVVAAAASLADANGLHQLTLARLAAALGIRSPSLYAHIDGLDDLRTRLGARGARELATTLQSAAAGRARGDALRAIAVAYREYAHAHPGTYGAMQIVSDSEEFEAAGTEVVGVILAVLRGYGLEGEPAIHAVRAIRSALHGFVSLERESGFGLPINIDDSYDILVAMLDAGLAATP